MAFTKHQNKISQLIAATLAILCIYFFYLISISPSVKKYNLLTHEILTLEIQRADFNNLSSKLKGLQSQYQSIKDITDPEPVILSTENETLAGASIQNNISSIINESGSTLMNMELLPSELQNNISMIAVNIQFTTTIDALRTVLYLIESNKPYMYISTMSIIASADHFYIDKVKSNLEANLRVFSLMIPASQ